ncbi:MAG: site-2 protease family protein, partial [Kiritimatiellia bacterium]
MIFNSPTLARIKDIDVRMHWSLPVLMLLQLWNTDGLTEAFQVALLFAGLLLGVTLHELGHCVVARRKGLEVRDILLTPIGGIAFVAGPVHSPRDEMQIAIAGPLVSFALALPGALLFAGLLFVGFPEAATLPLIALLIPNLSLGVFNLLPAFPMDGGRVLRAVLTEKRGAVEATRIAAKIGQGLATLLFLAGLFTLTFSLIFIGLF